MTTCNIVTWVIQLNIVDWVYSRTQTLLETLWTHNQHQDEFFCIFGSRTFVPMNWMCKKQMSWRLVCAWMVSLLLIYGIWRLKYCDQQTKPNHQPIPHNTETDARQVIACETHPNSNKRETENCHMWIMSSQTHNSLRVNLSCTFLKIMNR